MSLEPGFVARLYDRRRTQRQLDELVGDLVRDIRPGETVRGRLARLAADRDEAEQAARWWEERSA